MQRRTLLAGAGLLAVGAWHELDLRPPDPGLRVRDISVGNTDHDSYETSVTVLRNDAVVHESSHRIDAREGQTAGWYDVPTDWPDDPAAFTVRFTANGQTIKYTPDDGYDCVDVMLLVEDGEPTAWVTSCSDIAHE